MIDISFEINGRKVHPNQVADELEKAMLEELVAEVKKKVGSVRDPKTGQRPRITFKGRSIDNLSFEVRGSEELVELVRKQLS